MEPKSMFDTNSIGGVSGLFAISGDFGICDGLPSDIKKMEIGEDFVKVIDPAYTAICRFTRFDDDVFTRNDTFVNTSDKTITLYKYLMRFAFRGGEYEVYSQSNGWQNESRGEWQPLVTTIESKNRGLRTCESAAPFIAIRNKQDGKGLAFHLMPNSQWKMTVSKEIVLGGYHYTVVEMGISDNSLKIPVKPQDKIEMPQIIFYEFNHKTDMDCYKLHRFCNKHFPRRDLPVMYNTWFLDFYKVDFDKVVKQIETASKMGFDYFVLDAGWFGDGGTWSRCIGMWEENVTGAYCGRMKEISDLVKKNHMKFGLWLEPERALPNVKSVKEYPDYYFTNGHSCFLDFSNPDALEYIKKVTFELIEKYNIDFLKFDLNDGVSVDESFMSFYEYHKGFAEFISEIHRRYPSIYIENCASGGERMELNQLTMFDSFWISDNQSVYDGLRIYKDSLLRLPPSCMEKWVALKCAEGFTGSYGTNSKKRLIACNNATWDAVTGVSEEYLFTYLTGGLIGFSCDISDFSEDFKEKYSLFIENFKREMSFWKNCECRILLDNDNFLALQYSDCKLQEIKICLYTKHVYQDAINLFPKLDPDTCYTYENGTKPGKSIMESGITIRIPGNDYGTVYQLNKA